MTTMTKHSTRGGRKNRRATQKRGGSAWQYTEAVYGGPGQQVAVSEHNNQIKANIVGGRKNKRGGKSTLVDIAVPAALLYANTVVRRGTLSRLSNKTKKAFSKRSFSRKNRRA